jgi:SnoaL-like domain
MTLTEQPSIVARNLAMPAPVAAYVAATNAFDPEALLTCFADGALVNDQLRDHWGLDAIGSWVREEVVGVRLTMKVVEVVDHFGDTIVTAEMDGDYDKAGLPVPLVLAFHFTLRADKVVRLIILNNRTRDSAPEIRVLHGARASRRAPDD